MKNSSLLFSFVISFVLNLNVWASKDKVMINSSSAIAGWKIKPQSDIGDNITTLLQPGYDTSGWVKAGVPGTVFGSYVDAGLEKDLNFGENIYMVDKSKYDRNFWYRTEINTSSFPEGEHVWLNFEGVNRKGEVYFNGVRLGLLDGFMDRGCFDITHLIRPSGNNVLAVLVYWPTNPIPNHASPTYISSAGWDWMPYVPGLLSGIVDDVYLTASGDVTLIDPWIRTVLPANNDTAYIRLQVELKNTSDSAQTGILKGIIQPGNIGFSQEMKIAAGKQRTFNLNPGKDESLAIANPRLWWPNGYGEPNLYTCELSYEIEGKVSDRHTITFGIKKYEYDSVPGGAFRLKVNGQPVYVKGGNWGMSEYMLRCRGEEYDLKIRLHKEMNYNMIRNWIGSTTDEEFYEACDKYGIMVWDDFWLNSHNNLPDDVFAFNKNAVEKIKRLRNHPCIAVWCGDNEGYPLPPLDGWLRENVKTFDAGDRLYHSNSNSDGLSGSGLWANFHPNWYFTKYPGGFGKNLLPGWGFRTEIGTGVFTNFESFKKFMPEDSWWPRNDMWDKHFFGPSASNASPDKYFSTVARNYGESSGIEEFCIKSQLLNIEANKAMYEGWQHHMWKDATGIMTWMSQSAYPSLVWQTYDYYYDLNGAYWGVKKACEPVHIQWSYADNTVKAVNTTLNKLSNMTAEAKVYNLDGKEQKKYGHSKKIDVPENNITDVFSMEFTVDNLACKRKAVASSTSKDAGDAADAVDGNDGSRWASEYSDDQWIYVDLGRPEEIGTVILKWEGAYAKEYELQISDDAETWKTVCHNADGKSGLDEIKLSATARYVKMKGIKRATQWGYSLYEMEVYGKERIKSDLTPVHFVRLKLTDVQGKLVSENFYWRSNVLDDYQALSSMPKAKLSANSTIKKQGKKSIITANIKNTGSTVAFAVHVQAKRTSDGERILPAIMNDNYFTLLQGESKQIEIEFDTELLQGKDYKLEVKPFR